MRRRLTLLLTVGTIALLATACGRASKEQINQLLGITPTATLSAEAIASATAAVSATAAAKELAASSSGAAASALGDVSSGSRQFETWCAGCHTPGGKGPNLLEAGGPGASVTAESLKPLVRDGVGHSKPPGPFLPTEISDKQIADIAAYLNSKAGG
ncbi:MAG: cytochrome c [Thermomicrobiales bacterium]